jgi:hypothetical protein
MNNVRKDKETEEQQRRRSIEQISSSHLSSSSSSSPSTVILRDHAELIRTRRQCHSSVSLLQHQPCLSSSFEQPFLDCKPFLFPDKVKTTLPISSMKISTCTMTGKSLNNLDECQSNAILEEKAVQTTLNEHNRQHSPIKRAISTTSLSSSSAVSIQTDSQEKKTHGSTTAIPSKPTIHHDHRQQSADVRYKWPHLHERLLGEQTCTYWVNYLGSTAIKMFNDGMTAMPSQAITRLKQSTQYARVLPIIGLNISSRGVEFLKHTKDRIVICCHEIKTIHCACQDEDLRYFAYVTREQRLTNGLSPGTSTVTSSFDQHQRSSPSLSITSDYHHYCHVFVVKSDAMSTEV